MRARGNNFSDKVAFTMNTFSSHGNFKSSYLCHKSGFYRDRYRLLIATRGYRGKCRMPSPLYKQVLNRKKSAVRKWH